MAKNVFFVEKGGYRNGEPWANGVRGPNGQRYGGSGNAFALSLSPEVAARFKNGVTNVRISGTHKNVASSGIRKATASLRLEKMV